MTKKLKRPIERFKEDLWVNLAKLGLLVLAVLDQFKGFFKIADPYDHYLSILGKYIIFFFIVEFLQRFIVFTYKVRRKIKKQDNIVIGIIQTLIRC